MEKRYITSTTSPGMESAVGRAKSTVKTNTNLLDALGAARPFLRPVIENHNQQILNIVQKAING